MTFFTKRFTRRRRAVWIKLLGVLLMLLVLLLLSAPRLIGWIIGHELHTQLASRMNARLDFSRVVYQYPYGVRIEKAHLLMPAGPGGLDSWIDIGQLELKLAKLPLGSGPLLIEKLAIDRPVVHLSASSGSSSGSSPAASPPHAAGAAPLQKLSDLFQLQHASVTGGRFEYDFGDAAHPSPPILWGNLNVNMNTSPASGGLYQFAIAVADQPVVTANVTGLFDIDSLQLDAGSARITITCDPGQNAPEIPPQGRAFIRKCQFAGQLTVQGSASVPLQNPGGATFTANADLTNAHCQPPGFAAPITPTLCSIRAIQQAVACRFDLKLQDQNLAEASARGSVDLRTLLLDLQACSIKLHCDPNHPTNQLPAPLADLFQKIKPGGQLDVDGLARLSLLAPARGWYAARASVQQGECRPVGWSGPVEPAELLMFAGNASNAAMDALPTSLPQEFLEKAPESHAWLKTLSASSGNQLFKIDSGEIDLNPQDNAWTVRKVHGLADVGDGPGPLEGADTRIYVPFILSGNGKGMAADSSVRLALDDASASLTPNHVHINRINGMFTITPTGLRSSELIGKCADGLVKAAVNLDWQNAGAESDAASGESSEQSPPVSLVYDGDAQISQLDLHQLAMQYTRDPAVRQAAFGQLDFHGKYQGSILRNSPASGPDSPADRLSAQGDFDIIHGHFIDIPILKDLLIAMHSPSGSTVGEAAAVFDIQHSVVNLDRTGASSPVLGIQGGGTVTFAKQVNMNFVATPLADWARDLKGAGLLSDVGAAIVGKAQDVVNGLQRAIYQFRVTGDLSKPKVEPVVVPFLTDKMGPLFKKMAGDQSPGSIFAALKLQRGDNK